MNTNTSLDIIKSPSAARMLKSVTAGFYDQSRIALWLYEVIGREYDVAGDWVKNLKNEIFPLRCTWSIGIWEDIYGIEQDDTLPLEYRRQRVHTRRLTRPPLNPARVEALLTAMIGAPVSITENIAPYTFAVEVAENESNRTIYDTREALKALRQIKPSHESFRFTVKMTVEVTNEETFRFINLSVHLAVQEGSARVKGATFNGAKCFDGSFTWESSYQGLGFPRMMITGLRVKQEYNFTGKVTLDTRWYFDGTYSFDGEKTFKADIEEVAL